MGSKWYVARTEPRGEFLAAAELARDGFEIFSPRVKEPTSRRRHADYPLFPGYLFIRWDLEAGEWPSFRRVHRITGWVRFGGEIPWLPDEVVAGLMERWETINRQGGVLKRFPPGEKVRIVSGSLQGLAQVVEEAKSPQARAKVLLQFMGRLVQAHVPWESLRPLDNQPADGTRIPRRTRGGGRWIRGFGPSAPASA